MSYYIKSIDGNLLASGSLRGLMSVNLHCCLLRYLPTAVSGAYFVVQIVEGRLDIRVDVILGNSERRRKRRKSEMT